MTPKEKWKRLNNPQSIKDYGIIMTEPEIRQVPEARLWLLNIKKIIRNRRLTSKICKRLNIQLNQTLDNLIKSIIK